MKMQAKYQALRRPLKINEIDFRVQRVSDNGIISIVPYKDARTDMAILNEAGVKWQRKHETIGGNLFCSIGIYDEDIKEWLWRSDVGTKGNFEPEKSESTDSFKRAGTNWGIGMELYEIKGLTCKMLEDENPKYIYPNKWMWYLERDEAGNITRIACKDEKGRKRVDVSPKEHGVDGIQKGKDEAVTIQMTVESNDKLNEVAEKDKFIGEIAQVQSLQLLTELVEYKRETFPGIDDDKQIKKAIAKRTQILLEADN